MPLKRVEVRPVLPLWAAVPASIAAGFCLDLAFPDVAWWPLAFVAVVLALVSIIGRRAWSSVLVGFAFAAPFFLTNQVFTARYLGPVPWLALSLFEAVITAAEGSTCERQTICPLAGSRTASSAAKYRSATR